MIICYYSSITIRLQHFCNDAFVQARRGDVATVSAKQLLDPVGTLGNTAQFSHLYFRRCLHSHYTARRILHFEDTDDVVVMVFYGVVEARFAPFVLSVRITLFVQQKFYDD